MPLTTYSEVRPWAKAIKEQVLARRMPPWGAIRGFGSLRNDASLPLQEIAGIADWVEGGSPEGEPVDAIVIPRSELAITTPRNGKSFKVSNRQTTQPLRLLGLRVPASSSGSAQVVAEFPDGRTEPLLWIYNHGPIDPQSYWFTKPLGLPKGSHIKVSSPHPISLTLVATPARSPAP